MYAVHTAEIGDRAVAVLAAIIADAALGVVDAEMTALRCVAVVFKSLAPRKVLITRGIAAGCEVHGQLPGIRAPIGCGCVAACVPAIREYVDF